MSGRNHLEENLLRALNKKEAGSWKRWYDQVSPSLFSLALRYVHDYDTACDVLQNSFLKIMDSLPQFEFRGEGSLRAWASRIVINESLGELKKQGKLDRFDDLSMVEQQDEEPEVQNLSSEEILEMVRGLPDGYRVVFNLFVIENKSHKEIAQLLGISESTSASQFYRARRMLSKLIKEYQTINNQAL